MSSRFRISPGDEGEAVRDLQQRLADLGYQAGPVDGAFSDLTEQSVRVFQAARGLRVDGICGRQTWSSLVEAGYTLGDRLLYHRTPMLRGDDTTELQARLNALGFDAGREDGIYGPQTASALLDFQRNAGLASDGICGPDAVASLRKLSRFAGGSVAAVRERDRLRRDDRSLAGRRLYLAVEPGLDALGEAVGKGLVDLGADALVGAAGDDESVAAAEANRFAADLFLGVRFGDTPGCSCDYFATRTFRSEGGYRVARAVLGRLERILGGERAEPTGRAYAVLRETRMPAVVCQPVAGDDAEAVRMLVGRAGDAGRAIVAGIRHGVEAPFDDPP